MPAHLRTLSLILLALWIGGIVVLGVIAAPAVFSVLQAHDAANGRTLAGLLFGEILLRFEYLTLALGGAILVLLAARGALGRAPRGAGLQIVLLAAMMAMTCVNAFVVSPRLELIRDGIAGPIASLPDADPREAAFGRWHGLSTGLVGLVLAGGLIVFWIDASSER